MASQKQLKKVLKRLMNEPENLHCVDCNDKRPTWASILVPPPGAPFTEPIGCFMCYHCSGAHRRIGTHICFVRSTNLDEWKEKEILAMKRGGNKAVNAIFEATLKDKSIKPDKNTDLEPRSEFIYEKYEHRTWYSNVGGESNDQANMFGGGDPFANVGSQDFKIGSQEFKANFGSNGSQAFQVGSQEFRANLGSGSQEFRVGSQEFKANFDPYGDDGPAMFSPKKSPGVFGDFTPKARISLISNLESKEYHANVLDDIAHLDIGDDPMSPEPKPKRISMKQMIKRSGSARSRPKRQLSNEMEL